jgi:hypothetical protein
MEPSHIFIFATFSIAAVLGATTKNNWIAIGLPMLIPVLSTAARFRGPGLGETLLFVSPFLVAGAVLFAGICYAGTSVGRGLRGFVTRKLDKNHDVDD